MPPDDKRAANDFVRREVRTIIDLLERIDDLVAAPPRDFAELRL